MDLSGSATVSETFTSVNGTEYTLGYSDSIRKFHTGPDSGSDDTFTTGNTLTFTGGEGIDTTVGDDVITIAGRRRNRNQ